MTFQTYHEALTYFFSYAHFNPSDTSKWKVSRMRDLLARLGHPERRYPAILIAGTKGKGSTAAICESILRHAGLKTGLYTSPHLHSFRERIRIGGEVISEELLIRIGNELRPFFESTPDLSAFELITALAFYAFAETEVDAAVLEVGLGGRLDATNAIDPTLAVITPISYDHMQILGDTLTLIAREKAGIIRPESRVVIAPQFEEARQTLDAICAERQATLVQVERDHPWRVTESSRTGQTFTVGEQSYHLPLIGEHQVVNAVTALAAVANFAEQIGFTLPEGAVEAGLAQVKWPGRMEFLSESPYLLLDSAMNGHSAAMLVQALRRYFPERRVRFIFGASADHPIDHMLEQLTRLAHQMYAAAARHPRAASPERLVAEAAAFGHEARPMPDVPTALETALAEGGPDDVICAAGSLFLVADVREAWLRRTGQPLPPIDPIILS